MTKQKHYDLIVAWANGAMIEKQSTDGEWFIDIRPTWNEDAYYRIKPQPKPDRVHEALISLSFHAGPLLHPASPSEANIVLLFDGETGKLKQCTIKGA